MPPKSSRSISPFILLCLSATASHAQDATVSQDGAPMARVEVSGASGVQQRRDDTAAKIIISREDIAQYGENNLTAMLKRQPGVSVVGNEVRMRGLGAGYTQILINGDPAPPGFSIEAMAPEMIERIEILRSATAEYSMQAVAGSINLILRKGASRKQRVAKLGTGRVAGRWNPSASLSVEDKLQGFSYALTGALDRSTDDVMHGATQDSAYGPAGEALVLRRTRNDSRSSINKASLTPRLNWVLDNGDTLSWQSLLDWYRTAFDGTARETSLLGAATSYPDNDASSQASIFSARSDVSWVHAFGAAGKLTARLGLNHNRRDTDYGFDGNAIDGTSLLLRRVVSWAVDDSYNSSGKYLARLGGGHALSTGWDGSLIRRSEARSQRDTFPAGGAPYALDEDYTADVQRLALFAQDEWDMTPRLQMYAGVRWEGLRTATEGATLAKVQTRSSVWSPVLHMLWKLPEQERDQLRLALARTYKAPGTRSLVPRRYTINNGNSANNPDFQGNPDLRPELAWGLDLAYESYFGKSGVASVSAFARRISDVTVQRLYEQDGIWITSPFNNGIASVHGIEADLKFPLRTWLAGAPDIDLRANAARNWSRVDAVPGPGNRLASQVPSTLNLGLDYRLSPAISMGGNFNLQTGGLARLDAYSSSYSSVKRSVDAYALWQPEANTRVRLSLANLLRQQRVQGQSYADAAGSSSSVTSTPGQATIRLMMERSL
ncbi:MULTISPECIES: TonB-dependent siderophore receptor [unclassified Janthinobacterium]|uniref:TonB-dependent receptor plug domain-containing protein n=1 Tax=unclassified Janthinobacterium TaxID=2610881 RepID=UPI00179E2D4C|nr:MULTISPECIES: TonB-dependent receptor [unclassified Janthinobacterium]MBB5609468.1 outer membrane receptor protein involved in Fe transport [Janthinobacterium sp. S3T4]MBB5614685.1 outer membrane receptor protein involved in Fe transport [Janthinobacterium sp. S3M3]